jgi:hypothetical protein
VIGLHAHGSFDARGDDLPCPWIAGRSSYGIENPAPIYTTLRVSRAIPRRGNGEALDWAMTARSSAVRLAEHPTETKRSAWIGTLVATVKSCVPRDGRAMEGHIHDPRTRENPRDMWVSQGFSS